MEAEFTLQDGWFKTESLSFTSQEFNESLYIRFNYLNYTTEAQQVLTLSDSLWLEIPLDQEATISGFVYTLYQNAIDGSSYFTFGISDLIGDTPICHMITVYFDGEVTESYYEEVLSGTEIEFIATFEEGVIWYVD